MPMSVSLTALHVALSHNVQTTYKWKPALKPMSITNPARKNQVSILDSGTVLFKAVTQE